MSLKKKSFFLQLFLLISKQFQICWERLWEIFLTILKQLPGPQDVTGARKEFFSQD